MLSRLENGQRTARVAVTESIARSRINGFKQLLVDSNDILTNTRNENALQLLQNAQEMLTKAEDRLQQRNYILAAELADVGADLLRTALRMVRSR